VATKVMQTALAVRDVWMLVADIIVFVVIYVGTMLGVAAAFDLWLLLPFLGWLLLYVAACVYFVPRLGKVGQLQADARSLMTGRVTDAYANIATVKLFSHAHREAGFAKAAMQDFMVTAYGQMRLVSAFEIVNQMLSMALVACTAGAALLLWSRGQVGVGAVAATTAMALRLNGISHWVMWELASLLRARRHGPGRDHDPVAAARGGRCPRREGARSCRAARSASRRRVRLSAGVGVRGAASARRCRRAACSKASR
jgi:ATP-binding cassette subfamily B multidrug efflux pump